MAAAAAAAAARGPGRGGAGAGAPEQTLWRQARDAAHSRRPAALSSRRRSGGCHGNRAVTQRARPADQCLRGRAVPSSPPPGRPARAHLQPPHVLSFERFGGRKEDREEQERGGGWESGRRKKAERGRRKKSSFADRGITCLRGCQSKRFCLILFVFATEAFRVGLARGRNGWGEGDRLSGWRDLFIPLDLRGDDLDAGLLEIHLKDPHPAPTVPAPPAWLRGTLGGCTEKPSAFSRTAPTGPAPRGRGKDVQPGPRLRAVTRRPTRVCALITTTKPAPQPHSWAAFSTGSTERPETSKPARGRRRRLSPGFISRESSILRTRCQHSGTVYGIRIPQGCSSAVQSVSSHYLSLSWTGARELGCLPLALKRGGGGGARLF